MYVYGIKIEPFTEFKGAQVLHREIGGLKSAKKTTFGQILFECASFTSSLHDCACAKSRCSGAPINRLPSFSEIGKV